MKLETLCEDIYDLKERQDKLFNPSNQQTIERPNYNNFITAIDDINEPATASNFPLSPGLR
jgi:hypothetical protein